MKFSIWWPKEKWLNLTLTKTQENLIGIDFEEKLKKKKKTFFPLRRLELNFATFFSQLQSVLEGENENFLKQL